jgi:dTDP-glucose 4,6-dehydratase
MRRLLVTGGAGFIGTNFVHYWLNEHPADRVVVLDALTYAGNLANLDPVKHHPSFRFVQGDICDTPLVERLLRDERLDTIVHFAAESHVDRSIAGPDAFIHTNVIGTHSMLKAARQVWLEEKATPTHRFHHVSTDEVYGSLSMDDPPFTEATPYAPNSPYSASKAASDHLVRAYHHTYGLQTTISNCSNNFGSYQYPEKLIPLMITNILEGRPLPVYGDGKNVRDWLNVGDHCRAIDLVLERGRPGEVYNIGGGVEQQNIDLVNKLCAIAEAMFAPAKLGHRYPECPAGEPLGARRLITYVRDRAGHDRRYAIDCSKARTELGYRPSTDFDGDLLQTFQWFLDNEAWWRSVRQRSERPSGTTAVPSVALSTATR